MRTNKVVINKEAYEAAKAAGEVPEGQTFAQWRQAMKATAEVENKEVVIGAMPTVATPTIDDAVEVLNKVDTAIATVTAAKVEASANTKSKMSYARAIFVNELEKQAATGVPMVRKNVLARFMTPIEAGGASCKEKGANTYLQNLRDEFGLTAKKTKTA